MAGCMCKLSYGHSGNSIIYTLIGEYILMDSVDVVLWVMLEFYEDRQSAVGNEHKPTIPRDDSEARGMDGARHCYAIPAIKRANNSLACPS